MAKQKEHFRVSISGKIFRAGSRKTLTEDEVWDILLNMREAEEFVTVISQVNNGGFAQLFDNYDDGYKMIIRKAGYFTEKYAPKHHSEFMRICRGAESARENFESNLDDAKRSWDYNGNFEDPEYEEELDEADDDFYEMHDSMMKEIGKNLLKAMK